MSCFCGVNPRDFFISRNLFEEADEGVAFRGGTDAVARSAARMRIPWFSRSVMEKAMFFMGTG